MPEIQTSSEGFSHHQVSRGALTVAGIALDAHLKGPV